MADDAKLEVIQSLKACVMSRKGGVPFHALNADYRELLGEDVPFTKFGHESLISFLRSVPGILVDEREGNVSAAATSNTRHLQDLISKQKDNKSNKYKPYKKPNPSLKNKNSRNYYHRRPLGEVVDYDERNEQFHQPNKQQPYSYPSYRTRREHCDGIRQHPHRENYYEKKIQKRADRENDEPEQHKHHRYLGGRKVLFQNGNLTIVNKVQECESENEIRPSHRSFHSTNSSCFADYQVFGDVLMLDLLACEPSMFCNKDMTIVEASLRVMQFGCDEKVVIALGTIDILKGVDVSDLIEDMRSLIRIVVDTGAEVIVCTIPPMPSISGNLKAISTVVTFNNWLKRTQNAAVINLDKVFKSGVSIKFDLYKRSSVQIPGCMWPLTLLNEKGQNVVSRELLEQCLQCS